MRKVRETLWDTTKRHKHSRSPEGRRVLWLGSWADPYLGINQYSHTLATYYGYL